jgi:pimeloyl-ACP methyl ester carboxylesterase
VPLAYLRDLCGYWADGYDWRPAEARLNALPQFQTEIDGIRIVFAHVRSPRPDALPLILTHGWPGSVMEFLKVVGPLADPDDGGDAFHVVCPSLPGYGFSGKPGQAGWGVERIARAWAELMARLGYSRYGAAGSDWVPPSAPCWASRTGRTWPAALRRVRAASVVRAGAAVLLPPGPLSRVSRG